MQCAKAQVTYERGKFDLALEEVEICYEALEPELRQFIDPYLAAFLEAVIKGERQPLPSDVF